MNEHDIVRFLHSRFGALLMMAVAFVATIMSFVSGNIGHIPGDTGMWLVSANEWIDNGLLSLAINLLANAAIAILLVFINKRYNVMRSVSCLFAGLFMVMQMSEPAVLGQFHGGTLLCMTVVCGIAILFSTFNRPFPRQPVFLVFLLLGTGMMTQYAYVLYIPVFLLGCAQMRIFDIKTAIAAFLGVVTPVWIMWGFGFISFSQLPIPQFVNLFVAIDNSETIQLLVSTGFTLLLMLSMGVLNLMRVYNYNSQMRAFNGFISIVTFLTAIFVVADFKNMATYLPLVNCCAAFQTGHFFASNTNRRSYIALLGIISVYVALYWWSAVI